MSPGPSTAPPADAELEAAAHRLARLLEERGWQLGLAESCTGGLVGHAITELPGASDHYLGSVVSYSNDAKTELLGVPSELIDREGAVSAAVAAAMAAGALERFPAAYLAVSVTGIAGPEGGSADKPVGLSFVAAALRDGSSAVERHSWSHDRAGNKRASALAVLELAARLASAG